MAHVVTHEMAAMADRCKTSTCCCCRSSVDDDDDDVAVEEAAAATAATTTEAAGGSSSELETETEASTWSPFIFFLFIRGEFG